MLMGLCWSLALQAANPLSVHYVHPQLFKDPSTHNPLEGILYFFWVHRHAIKETRSNAESRYSKCQTPLRIRLGKAIFMLATWCIVSKALAKHQCHRTWAPVHFGTLSVGLEI
ncbi:hypothetical protein BKA64DRAFT_287167 [Cadophora sp. MPI-SDFR-AT-0126]|nr:hypothetical protein BKA64DRAFT_287167 [Leotiomycetes sp. MPI-SDFR-AT-0126]